MSPSSRTKQPHILEWWKMSHICSLYWWDRKEPRKNNRGAQERCQQQDRRKYTQSSGGKSTSAVNKFAFTGHVSQENHKIDWKGVKVIDRENQRSMSRVKEAIQICRHTKNMNQDQGAYQLSHTYDCLVMCTKRYWQNLNCLWIENLWFQRIYTKLMNLFKVICWSVEI